MDRSKYLSRGDFCSLCGITKNTLIWYEKKGLVKPAYTEENGYHYYTREQFFEIDLIKALKWADFTLEKCRDYIEHRDEDKFVLMMLEQQRQITSKYKALSAKKSIIDQTLQDYLTMKSRYFMEPGIIRLPETPLLIERIPNGMTRKEHMLTLKRLYNKLHKYTGIYGVTSSMLNCLITPGDHFRNGEKPVPEYAALKMDAQIEEKDCVIVPSGKFVIFNYRGKPSECSEGYRIIDQYIRENNLTSVGDVYEYDMVNYLMTNREEENVKEILVRIK